MSPLSPLIAFHLRQVVPGADSEVGDFVALRLAQPAGPLTAALVHAAGRTWRALAASLLPGCAPGWVRSAGAGDTLWIEDQLRRFADQTAQCFRDLSDDARLACLAEWRRAQEGGRIGGEGEWIEDLASRTAANTLWEDSAGLAAAGRVEALVAAELAQEHPQLGRLLREQAGAPPLLAAAFAYFFRREVESNEDLSGELMCDGLRRLSAPLAGPLGGLAQALARLGSRFDALVAQLLQSSAAAVSAVGGRATPAETAAAHPAPLGDRPSPFVALRRPRKAARGEGRRTSESGIIGARPSSVLITPPIRPAPLGPRSKSPSRPGPSFVNALGMLFVWVPPGDFRMGSPPDEAKREADERLHRVRITRGFFLGAHPVTRGQFAAFVRETQYITEAERKGGAHRGPSGEWRLDPWCNWKRPDFPQDDDHPVVCVSWNDARAFCEWLAGRDRQKEGTYRLPTEAEWECACRAGTTTEFWPGEALGTDQANYNGKTEREGLFREATTPVGVFAANAWGLHDVHGNVWEWCADWYGPYPEEDAVDPQGASAGRNRVVRGGSWRNQARFLRSAARNQMPPAGRDRDVGFRVCLVV